MPYVLIIYKKQTYILEVNFEITLCMQQVQRYMLFSVVSCHKSVPSVVLLTNPLLPWVVWSPVVYVGRQEMFHFCGKRQFHGLP